MRTRFRNRTEAGQMLAQRLQADANSENLLVLALPRGGVPVAFEVAKALHAPLDVCLVRKLGVPGHEELAMGAIASQGVGVLNHDVINSLGINRQDIQAVIVKELEELKRRDRTYRGDKPALDVNNKTIILIDDGIATGSTMRAAIAILRQQQPAKIIVAVPIAPPSTYEQLQSEVDEIVCLQLPDFMSAIAAWYDDFSQTTDEEVCELLAQQPTADPVSVSG
jgi:putative phosphoribosyl transferase